ncbi:pentapeptide repeat-containing protein [Streptomyces celluloflavus]|uniref:pentapeptide repeat-containing protein n=1 Tax=Streptomyces celluloflavus TaxID=58344 RepID=UPI00364E6EBD
MWIVAPTALAIVGALAYGLYQGAVLLLDSQNRTGKPVDVNDTIKTTVTVLTLIGAVLTGIYAYRKQLLAEGDSRRADASQLADRYSTAAEQLGHEQAAVRLAGVYALARLADDWPEQRQVCIDVLCAYLRMPYETDRMESGFKAGEREVRLTIIRSINDHLQEATAPTTWCGLQLNFTGATFDGGDFQGAVFTGKVDFQGARFVGGTTSFDGAWFASSLVTFSDAQITGGEVTFKFAKFIDGTVSFQDSQFTGGEVSFAGAQLFGGLVIFSEAQFTHSQVLFFGTEFMGSGVSFRGAEFASCGVAFLFAKFTAGSLTFHGVRVTDSDVDFLNACVASAARIDWGPFPAIPPS